LTAVAPARPFLRARWEHLLVVTYPVAAELVRPLAPTGVTVDQLGGHARVSLVAFDFAETRVHGVQIPGNVDFPEVNLRFYVRAGADRGIVFVREFVPRRLVALVARARYNEPYRRIAMDSTVRPHGAGRLRIDHAFGRMRSTLGAEVDAAGTDPAEGSDERWLTHQTFGFGQTRRGQTRRYRVEHPVWPLHAVHRLDLDVDFADLYGPAWAFLADAEPSHVTFAAGSEVAVYPPD
jgi:uncharacterized protein YqjF (DUF2071 family)